MYFGPDGPRLPESLCPRGAFDQGSWTVEYLLGQADGREYLDFYATNRFTNDRHVRIFDDGFLQFMESPVDFFGFKPEIPGTRNEPGGNSVNTIDASQRS